MRMQRKIFQMKEQDKTPEELSKVETSSLPSKEFKVMIINMLNKLGTRMDEHSENVNKKVENRKKNQLELQNTIMEMKHTVE